ncbi:hypothetical protein SPAR31_2309 [Streptococcus pneumoniae GA13494]|nr:hypothetical protein SPAR31_2309 [Streptococcus pneumoniae GA13494]
MNTLNEKAINIFKAVAKETLIQGTYEENSFTASLKHSVLTAVNSLLDGQS